MFTHTLTHKHFSTKAGSSKANTAEVVVQLMNAWINSKSQQQSELQLSARLVIHKKEEPPL